MLNVPARPLIGWVLLLGLLAARPAQAQQFGQNKIGYTTFQFKLHQTRNFDLYHYLTNDTVRNFWAHQSEIWYHTHRQVLRDSIPFRNPLLLYANHADFQQTNVTPGPIDPGTGGFAEAVKNRIVMPIAKANAQTDHVLGHEVVHALQFQMMQQDSLSVSGLFQLPLWFVEGMAEYMSIGPVDAHTSLWLRDAVLHRDLPTLNDMTLKPRFFPYRWGHAFWAYVTGTWGEQTIRPLFLTAARWGVDAAIQRVLRVTPAQFNQQWHEALRAHYRPFADQPARLPGLLEGGTEGHMHLAPSLSPNGRYVAFLSEKNLFSIDLFLADARTGRVIRKLLSTKREGHLDALSYLESAGTWSPDSKQFAFVAFAKGKNRLVCVDVRTGRIRREVEIPGVPAFSNPAWSADNRYLVVNGLVNGQPDLFLYDWEEGRVRQLTNDRYTELQPNWSPDGRLLTFATDQPAKQDDRTLAFDHRIAVLDVATNVTRILDVFPGADNLNPQFGQDNQLIYFLSDRDGYRNLYATHHVSGDTYQLTQFFTGITGITPHAPALSIARETGHFAFSVFERQGYRLRHADQADFLWHNVPAPDGQADPVAAIMPPVPRFNRDFVAARLNATRPNDPIRSQPVTPAPMRNRFRLIDINGGGGATGTAVVGNRFGTALSGGVNTQFGDLLGDRTIGAGLAVAGELSDITGQFTYFNRRKRINWGVSLLHMPFRSGAEGVQRSELTVGDQTVPVVERFVDLQRTFEQQLGTFAYLPISRTRRIELSAGVSRFSFRTVRSSDFFFRGQLVDSEQRRFTPRPDLYTMQAGLAYVGDNSTPGPLAPLRGYRYRLGADASAGPLQVQTLTTDYRHYWRLQPVTLAVRGLYNSRHGRDAASGLLPPFFVGFPTLVRGYAANTFLPGDGGVRIDQLQGSQMAVANAELRLSLLGHQRMALFRSSLIPTDLNLFADAGYAWGRATPWGELPNTRPVLSTGVSMRVNIGGMIILEPFWAIPWQRTDNTLRGVFGLNLAAGW